MGQKQMIQLLALGATIVITGVFIKYGLFSEWIWLWWALLIAGALSFFRECGMHISFS